MTNGLPAPDAPALTLFPIYTPLGDMVSRETHGLTDDQWHTIMVETPKRILAGR